MMRLNPLGRSAVKVSQISFGCGGTAGLMVRGTHEEQCSVVEAAIAAGINVFDTSPTYGGGHSETNLGAVLKSIGAQPLIGTTLYCGEGEHGVLMAGIEVSIKQN
jgi:L-glyceraldehyde 3-phosphate reductase